MVQKTRVIVLTDTANEADDQFALAHALLTPSFDVRGVVAQHFGEPGSAERSLEEARRVVGLAGRGDVPVVLGAGGPLGTGVHGGEGGDLVACEALRTDEGIGPLTLLCMGQLADVALALRAHGEIAQRLTVIWVGGGRYPRGSHEANCMRDVEAAREVLASGAPLWQIPSQAYKMLAVSVAQLRCEVEPCGELGSYLVRHLLEFRDAHLEDKPWINPESWVLGDQAAVGVLLADQKECWEERPAPGLADDGSYLEPSDPQRKIRVYRSLNDRLVLGDLFAKLALWAAEGGR